MKQKFLMLLAAVLLGSASAIAQSGNNEPLKGNVNGDGTATTYDYYLGIATEAQVQDQSYINGLSYNKTGIKPTEFTLYTGWNIFMYPSSWGTPTMTDDNGFGFTPYTAEDLGISNPDNKCIAVLETTFDGGHVNIAWNYPTSLYWFSYGNEEITASNYTTANNAQQVTEYPSEIEYTPESRDYLYILVTDDMAVEVIDAALGAPAYISENYNTIPGYKIVKTNSKIGGKVYIKINAKDPTGIGEIRKDKVTQKIYDLNGRRLLRPSKGINIIDGKKIVMK